MPPKPEYYHDLNATVKQLAERVVSLERSTGAIDVALKSFVQETTGKVDHLKDTVADLRREVAVLTQRTDDVTKQMEKWEGRWWGLLVVFVGALLSLAAGLITTLARR